MLPKIPAMVVQVNLSHGGLLRPRSLGHLCGVRHDDLHGRRARQVNNSGSRMHCLPEGVDVESGMLVLVESVQKLKRTQQSDYISLGYADCVGTKHVATLASRPAGLGCAQVVVRGPGPAVEDHQRRRPLGAEIARDAIPRPPLVPLHAAFAHTSKPTHSPRFQQDPTAVTLAVPRGPDRPRTTPPRFSPVRASRLRQSRGRRAGDGVDRPAGPSATAPTRISTSRLRGPIWDKSGSR